MYCKCIKHGIEIKMKSVCEEKQMGNLVISKIA